MQSVLISLLSRLTLRRIYRSHQIWSTQLKMSSIDRVILDRITTQELLELKQLFNKHSYELRLAGGAVRDLIMNKIPEDIDFATTATPDQMLAMFEQENIRVFNSNGIKHGTVSVRLNDKENFEITTLRIDVRTDGRHADVEFTTDWMVDANRRDLTINSLFLDLDGKVYDFFDGIRHINEKKVMFVGDATIRIRFFGVMNSRDHDPEVLRIIKERASGLGGISGERIWTEMKKIAVGPKAPEIFRTMQQCAIFEFIGLPHVREQELECFELAFERSHKLEPLPITLMAALFRDETDLACFHKRVHLSNDESDIVLLILHFRKPENRLSTLKCCLDVAVEMEMRNHCKVKEKLSELLKYEGSVDLISQLNTIDIPRFPVSGLELAAIGVKRGPDYGRILHRMRMLWKKSDFKLTNEQLMANVDKVIEQVRSSENGEKSLSEIDDFILAKKRRRIVSK